MALVTVPAELMPFLTVIADVGFPRTFVFRVMFRSASTTRARAPGLVMSVALCASTVFFPSMAFPAIEALVVPFSTRLAVFRCALMLDMVLRVTINAHARFPGSMMFLAL
jgi:hypothetical protein